MSARYWSCGFRDRKRQKFTRIFRPTIHIIECAKRLPVDDGNT
jgi:hypothetical protein